jgi:intein/homing endonuclease
MRGFVAGMADSDGGIVGLRRWYRFASISSELIKKLKEILESFDIEANIRIYRSKQKK